MLSLSLALANGECGRTMYTIRQRIGPLLMRMEKRYGKMEDTSEMTEKEIVRAERNARFISNRIREIQMQNYQRKVELKRRRETDLREGLQLSKDGKYEEALQKFESVLESKHTPDESSVASCNVACCYSKLNQEYLEDAVGGSAGGHSIIGDSVAWGGCTIIYLLGQQLHFELFDFSYQVLNVAEVEATSLSQTQKNVHAAQVLALVGNQLDYSDDVCGAVLTIRFSEDILSVWNRNAYDNQAVMALRDSIKRCLKLPHSYIMEYKHHNDSLRDNSSYRNTWLRG